MKQFFAFTFFASLLAVSAPSCKKKDSPAPKTVYVAGYTELGSDDRLYATYWKNDEKIRLTSSMEGEANDIALVGSDVYICGNVVNTPDKPERACYWKNGVLNILPGGDVNRRSSAEKIFVNGADVYIAGYIYTTDGQQLATYWKNGVPTNLSNGVGADCTDVFVSGTDVYAVGNYSVGSFEAYLWKNGVRTTLSDGLTRTDAYSVAVSGTDVYVCGIEFLSGSIVPILWKNGAKSRLPVTASMSGEATKVFVSGNDVYVCGAEFSSSGIESQSVLLWKNGTPVKLAENVYRGYATDIFVDGADVYVSGHVRRTVSTLEVATYWKNGVATPLSDESEQHGAYGIFVK